jgi:hypothetical protein
MFDVIHLLIWDSDVAFEIICEWSVVEDESDRDVAAAVVTFTTIVTLCWIIFDIISRMTAWIISCIFWFDRSKCWFVISASLEEEEIIEWHDSLCSWKISELRNLSFCSMIFEISSRLFSDNEIFSNDFVKFWEDSEKFWEDFENSEKIQRIFRLKNLSMQLSSWSNQLMILLNSSKNQSMILSFSWFELIIAFLFFKRLFVIFFELFLNNLNDICQGSIF